MAKSSPAMGPLMAWASKRRFPTLLLVVGGIFAIDLVVPDLIPFADEFILGVMTIILAQWKDRRAREVIDTTVKQE